MFIRLRYWTALLVIGGVSLGISAFGTRDPQAPDDNDAVIEAGLSRDGGIGDPRAEKGTAKPASALASPDDPALAVDTVTTRKVIGQGDSLSGLLADVGLDLETTDVIARAIGTEYDLRRLKPGDSLSVTRTTGGDLQTATLEIDDGSRIRATLGAIPVVQRLAPDLESVPRAGETTVQSSIFGAFEKAGIPTRFATDLELILDGTLDLRKQVAGGEHIRLMWREYRSGDRTVAEPTIDFAQLDLSDGKYVILWPDDSARRTLVFKDDELVRVFDQPIRGARLSSAFGPRLHPIHGTVRMHSGVDLAAVQGAAVEATHAGKIVYMGARSGYGNLVEVDHGGDVQTLYAHLSALNDDLRVGQSIPAGTEIGLAGSTGTSTAPHLHYEIHVDGKPVSPLDGPWSNDPGGQTAGSMDPLTRVNDMRNELNRLLASEG